MKEVSGFNAAILSEPIVIESPDLYGGSTARIVKDTRRRLQIGRDYHAGTTIFSVISATFVFGRRAR